MKAAVYYGKGDIRVESSFPSPQIGPWEVLVKVMACGVCGTDLHIFSGAKGATDCDPPVILGHEFSGIVEKVWKSGNARSAGAARDDRPQHLLRGMRSLPKRPTAFLRRDGGYRGEL